jgi:hypothetical protein
MRFLCATFVVAAVAAGCATPIPMSTFTLEEATVASVHRAFANGTLTCARLTQLYIDRIEAYNL